MGGEDVGGVSITKDSREHRQIGRVSMGWRVRCFCDLGALVSYALISLSALISFGCADFDFAALISIFVCADFVCADFVCANFVCADFVCASLCTLR